MKQNIIKIEESIKFALSKLNEISDKKNQTLFVIDQNEQLIGTITDGDIRRGFLKGLSIQDNLEEFINKNFKYLLDSESIYERSIEFLNAEIFLIPILDKNKKLIKILDFSKKQIRIPVDAVIMAGGKGQRLRPLTEKLPKPLLKVGGKPILERNVDRLSEFGIKNITLTVNYLGDMIKDYFKSGEEKELSISYVEETQFLGTIGSISLIESIENDEVLVMNSDLLTNIDYGDFYAFFKKTEADIAIATIPYEVNIPYAVLENENERVVSLKEKPVYTYYSNAGIYLIKKSLIDFIPKNEKYDATDLIEKCLEVDKKVVSYPMRNYWLDIGKHADFEKAQKDIEHIKF